MKRRKNILLAGLIVAAITVAGVSAYAAEDVTTDTKDTIEKGVEFFRGGDRGGRDRSQIADFDGERPEGMEGRSRQGKGKMGFDAAIEAGILTDEDVTNIEAYREANAPDMEAIKAELEDMTKEDARAYMEENYPRPEDPMADLVEAKILSQDQVDKLETLREEAMANRPERPEFDGERPEFDGERPEGMEGRGQGRGGMRPGNGQRPGSEETPAEDTSL